MAYITENNAERPATKKQLWALYCLTKKDYRGQDLTMMDASSLIKRMQAEKNSKPSTQKVSQKVSKEKKLEKEFIDYMTKEMEGVINTAKECLQIKSVVEDDPSIFTDEKKRQKYVFFGFGCGFTIIYFDKRSKVGKQIEELGKKHRMTTFLNMFLKAFTKKEIEYYESVGSPLSAIYYQDIRINSAYQHAVSSFMTHKGVKNVYTRTFDD